MVSNMNIFTFIFCLFIAIAVGITLFCILQKRSKAVETGMVGAVFYGAAGYLWGGLMLLALLETMIYSMSFFQSWKENFYVGVVIIKVLLESVFVVLAIVWGIYLTNQKQKSLYRSSAIGLGYGFAQAVIMIGMPLYTSIAINMGSQKETIDIATYSELPIDFILASGITWTAMMIFYTYLSLIIAQAVISKKWKEAAKIGLLYCLGVQLIRELIGLFPENAAFYIGIIVMLLLGGVFYRRFRKELDAK